MTHPARRPERLEDVLVEGMGLMLGDALRELFQPLFQRVARHRREQAERAAREQAREAERLRLLDPIEFIRDRAKEHRAAGSRDITRMFDDLYAQHGMTRQEH